MEGLRPKSYPIFPAKTQTQRSTLSNGITAFPFWNSGHPHNQILLATALSARQYQQLLICPRDHVEASGRRYLILRSKQCPLPPHTVTMCNVQFWHFSCSHCRQEWCKLAFRVFLAWLFFAYLLCWLLEWVFSWNARALVNDHSQMVSMCTTYGIIKNLCI